MLRLLFARAVQPYLRHMRVWAFTTQVRKRAMQAAG